MVTLRQDVYRNARSNRHPNLVFVHGLKQEHGLVYLIMDRCYCSLSTSVAPAAPQQPQRSGESARISAEQQVCGCSVYCVSFYNPCTLRGSVPH